MAFVHLHLHSEYSMLDGACRISELSEAAKSLGQTALAITDHGNMFGAVLFYKACKKAGIKPIIGCEVYVAPHSRFEKDKDAKYHHLVLLCENAIGYKNLSKLVSFGYTEGFYGKPRIDDELLAAYHEGLIALSGCLAGRIPSLILQDRTEEAEQAALAYANLFGPDHFYLEIQHHHTEEEDKIREGLINLSRKTGLPLVATNDAHYIRKTDAEYQAVLMCIQTGKLLSEGRAFGFQSDDFYLKSEEEMCSLFFDCPEALENTVKIAERCSFDFDFSTRHLPTFPLPEGVTADKYLKQLAEEGLKECYESGKLDLSGHSYDDYKFRMIYELLMIAKMGYSDYYLIVRDFVTYAKNKGIPVGPGRGSGAGSLVAYLVGITEIDSIRYDLLFERFLNPERVSMPDFDVDFCYNRRDEVIEYVAEKYGRDHVSQIAAFGTLGARAAVRDVGRVLGISYAETDAVAKLIPHKPDMTIKTALKNKELQTLYDERLSVKQLLDTAMAVEGMPRHITTHAAGVVITKNPVSDYMPLTTSSGAVLTQYDMNTVAELGLLKFDFLALRYLTVIDDAVKFIRIKEPSFALDDSKMSDEETFKMISDGETEGVFQLESPGMKRLLTQMRPRSVDDLMIAIALFRPGPMDSIPTLISARNSGKNPEYEIPILEEILQSTSGCIVFQEQVMQIFRKVAGYSYGRADVVRRAMAKKHADELEAERSGFLDGATKNFIDREAANRLFDSMVSFASYAFNKSHAAAYAVISFRTAYLKAHYPKEYISALLSSVCGDTGKTAEYIAALAKRGISILPPDVNESGLYFSPTDNGVRFGLLGIKNIGLGFANDLIACRKEGKFLSPVDFAERMQEHGLGKNQLLSLIGAGALDGFSLNRSQMTEGTEGLFNFLAQKKAQRFENQLDLFSMAGSPLAEEQKYSFPIMSEYTLVQRLMTEKELTGMWFSGHPLDDYSLNIKAMSAITVYSIHSAFSEDGEQLKNLKNGDTVELCVMISGVSFKTSKAGNHFAVLKLEDESGEIEGLVFEKVLEPISVLLTVGRAVYVKGKVTVKEEEAPRLSVFDVVPLLTNREFTASGLYFEELTDKETTEAPKRDILPSAKDVPAQKPQPKEQKIYKKLYIKLTEEEEKDKRLTALLNIFNGQGIPCILYYPSKAQYVDSGRRIIPSEYLISVMKSIAGAENIVLK